MKRRGRQPEGAEFRRDAATWLGYYALAACAFGPALALVLAGLWLRYRRSPHP